MQLHILHIFTNTSTIFNLHFISRECHAGKTAILRGDVHLPKHNRKNSLVTSSVIGKATSAGRGREGGREGKGSVTLQMEEMDEL
jgi:hypothetical protein